MPDARQSHARLDAAEIAVGLTLIPIAAVSFAGILLLELGVFRAATVAIVAAAIAIGLGVCAWLALRRTAVDRTRAGDWLTLVAVVGLATVLFRPPAEAYVGGGDASVYLAASQLIARGHGLGAIDPTFANLPPGALQGLVAREPRPGSWSVFPGGIEADANGAVTAEFFHLTPIWFALFDGWFGPASAARVNGLAGVLSIALVWALGRRLHSTWAGTMAAALLAVSFAQIWFARLPTSEMSMQYLALASVFWLLVSRDFGSSGAGLLAGLAAGLTMFGRVEAAVIVAGPLVAGVVLQAAMERRVRADGVWFVAAVCGVGAYALWHAVSFAGPYAARIVETLTESRRWHVGSVRVVLMAGAAAAGVVALHRAIGLPRWLTRVLLLAGGLLAIAWIVRQGPRVIAGPFAGLVTIWGLGPMLAGVALLLRPADALRALPLALTFLISAVIFLPNPRDDAGMPMLLRRFVPVLLPLGAVLIGHALASMARTRAGRLAGAAAATAIAVLWLSKSAFVLAQPVYAGVREGLSTIASKIPADAFTFHDASAPSHLPLALHYEFNRPAMLVSRPADARLVDETTGAAIRRGQPVRLLMRIDTERPKTVSRETFGDWLIQPVAALDFGYVAIDPAFPRLPGRIVTVTHRLGLYEVVQPPSDGLPLPARFDIGDLDFGWLASGFHGPERMDGTTARWTDGTLRIRAPALRIPPDALLDIVCRLATWRPAGVSSPRIEVRVDGTPAAGWLADRGEFTEYRAAISPEAAARLHAGGTLELESSTFVPSAVVDSTDSRRLGIAVDWIEIQPRARRGSVSGGTPDVHGSTGSVPGSVTPRRPAR